MAAARRGAGGANDTTLPLAVGNGVLLDPLRYFSLAAGAKVEGQAAHACVGETAGCAGMWVTGQAAHACVRTS